MCAMLLYLSASLNREIGIVGEEKGSWLRNSSLNKHTNNFNFFFSVQEISFILFTTILHLKVFYLNV